MADIAASVLTRLKNKAKETGQSYQLQRSMPESEPLLLHTSKIHELLSVLILVSAM